MAISPEPSSPLAPGSLDRLAAEVTGCRACPRLVAWRERVARERRAAFRDQEYWGRPLPGFGDPDPWLVLVGLAPAAHGANRTGRMFTGDRSGDFLMAALHRAGLASRPESTAADDGLVLSGARITAIVRCAPPANRPTPDEQARCRPFLERELVLCGGVRVVLCLGGLAWAAVLGLLGGPRPRPRFGHGAEVAPAGGPVVLGAYHPSQQNTFTGRLTPAMLDAVIARAREIGAGARAPTPRSPGATPKTGRVPGA